MIIVCTGFIVQCFELTEIACKTDCRIDPSHFSSDTSFWLLILFAATTHLLVSTHINHKPPTLNPHLNPFMFKNGPTTLTLNPHHALQNLQLLYNPNFNRMTPSSCFPDNLPSNLHWNPAWLQNCLEPYPSPFPSNICGSGYEVHGLEFRVWGLRFRV